MTKLIATIENWLNEEGRFFTCRIFESPTSVIIVNEAGQRAICSKLDQFHFNAADYLRTVAEICQIDIKPY